ncbi:FimV/HubP family polar landmark protein [Limnohabitans sp. Rim8]|uniref:type IV pilus assembly protein FimV n=1 Tax=Limnohabitans sp. Rim8 TaxID=1100718 RepID=UPI0025D1027A|nr:FimV/HubP family polar landmark protein [Limnohabitans sp. Rim8]
MLLRPMRSGPPTSLVLGLRPWLTLAVALASESVLALTLGQVSVESGIGQPLRAAIEITQYKVEDLRRLKLQPATMASYEQANMAFHPALNGLQTRLEFRGDGKPFIALTGLSPVNEHFIDVIVEAQWPSGRLAMNYTLLVSPAGATSQRPGNTQNAADLAAPVVSPLALAAVANPASVAETRQPLDTVRVRAGDTASRLVLRSMPSGVTLDQMLLAMVRANPEAFIEGNVNLLREGAEVQLPSAQEASQISAEEARQTVVAQTVDFAAYARRLAQSALQAPDTASREMNGKLSAVASTPAPQLPPQDTLTLSQREAASATDEARLAVEREIQDKTEQLAALQKNLDTLRSLAASKPPNTDQATAAESAPSKPLSPSLPVSAPPIQASSVLEFISQSSTVGAWALALLGGMWAWVWWVRRHPSKDDDLFAQHHHNEVSREPIASVTPKPHPDIQVERAPLPSGLPPQFAHLDLNLTPAPEARPPADAAQPAGPKA